MAEAANNNDVSWASHVEMTYPSTEHGNDTQEMVSISYMLKKEIKKLPYMEIIPEDRELEEKSEDVPQTPNMNGIDVIQHDQYPIEQLPLCSQAQTDKRSGVVPLDPTMYSQAQHVTEHRQTMISHSKLNPNAPEFIPRGRAAP